ncbi:hypothetical protein WG904_03450 [Pedobacter sp. Du54]|uniref:hypothetical protein n=1 Tax=Pedobacter anseongensis TaxID=3133439 RepID=UPI0030A56AE2
MSQFPEYVFDGSTDYNAVETTVLEMVSYLDEQSNCSACNEQTERALNKISFKLLAMQINSPNDQNNVERWKKSVEVCYKLLYPFT